jgi:hypothetical protein
MHFTYQTATFSSTELMQGDVLRRTRELNSLLETVHPHFFHSPKNLFFMVLTQSCDLVPRGANRICKAPYIAIAPVRSLDLVVERQVAQYRCIREHSIAVKADLHLNTCTAAKMLQLTDTFQAKLGWLVGQMYSRVGTRDMDNGRATKKIAESLKNVAVWVDEAIEARFGELSQTDPGKTMSETEIGATLRAVPSMKDQVIARATDVLREALGSDHEITAKKLISRLSSDAALTKLLR